jgi:RHH-type rel operon transcriptional repressor/antitoxin RelB
MTSEDHSATRIGNYLQSTCGGAGVSAHEKGFNAILVLQGYWRFVMGTAVSLRLPEGLKNRLDKLAKRTGRSKTYYMVEAISEKLEDLEDLYLAEERTRAMRAGQRRTYTQEEMEKRYGVAD